MSNFTVQVIDTACEAADKSFFPPAVTLSTASTTQIATLYGYNEFIASSPPKKYHSITYSGSAEQVAYSVDGLSTVVSQIADMKYIYNGSGTVDGQGNQTSNYTKKQYAPCESPTFSPLVDTNVTPVAQMQVLRGYCNTADPNSCPTCSYPPFTPTPESGFVPDWNSMVPVFVGNVANNTIHDWPFDLFEGSTAVINSSTSASLISQPSFHPFLMQEGGIGAAQNLFKSTINGIYSFWCALYCNFNVTATLTNEYTDAEALQNALVINSNGATAENFPRTTGFVSRFTSVNFILTCTDLIKGESYLVTVDLWTMPANTHTPKQYGFTADATTHTIHDSIAQPAAQSTTTVRQPTIVFSP